MESWKIVVGTGLGEKGQTFRFGCVNFKMPTRHPSGDSE